MTTNGRTRNQLKSPTSNKMILFRLVHTTKMFFYKKNVYLEDENNEGLSRIPKWTQVFLHGFDKRTIAETLI